MGNRSIKIANRKIGKRFAPYIIAELSANHNGKDGGSGGGGGYD